MLRKIKTDKHNQCFPNNQIRAHLTGTEKIKDNVNSSEINGGGKKKSESYNRSISTTFVSSRPLQSRVKEHLAVPTSLQNTPKV